MMIMVEEDEFMEAMKAHTASSGIISDMDITTGNTQYFDAHSKVLIGERLYKLTLRGNVSVYYIDDRFITSTKKQSPKYPGLEDYDFDSL